MSKKSLEKNLLANLNSGSLLMTSLTWAISLEFRNRMFMSGFPATASTAHGHDGSETIKVP
jgi:hypothetical protein